ncbi:MAG: DUF6029 family protein [Bacteroidota bacterium]
MLKSLHYYLFTGFILLFLYPAAAQQTPLKNISGSFQTDVQLLFPDSLIGAEAVDEKVLSNSYLQLSYQQGNFSAGLRYEAYLNPLLGFDRRYEGQGIANRFASYNTDRLELTVGNFYEQFGFGNVFRAYQEWSLGIDNSVDGVRMRFKPVDGLAIKGILGRQRKFWETSESLLRGGDLEVNLNELLPSWEEKTTQITLGSSFLNKFQADDDINLILPENVSAFAGRASIVHQGFNLDAEYAYKINDPFQLNKFVYNPGQSIYLNMGYVQKGLGILVSARRMDNMDFRSERSVSLQELTLSFLPAISRLHTYRMTTLYTYATQFNGEVGGQATLIYTIPRKTKLGGKYGTRIQLNYSRFHGLDTTFTEAPFLYESSFFGDPSLIYFEDANIEITKKWTRELKTIVSYIYMRYNADVVQLGTRSTNIGVVTTHLAIGEAQYKFNRKLTLRSELQWLRTKQDMGSWAMALAELSVSPNWVISVFDEYNYGNPEPDKRVHYYTANIAYAFGPNRMTVGYGRQRSGLLCIGGICREVPASNGFSFSLMSTF